MKIFFCIVLSIVAIIALGIGVSTMMVETTAIHQILCAIYFLVFTVATGSLGVMTTTETKQPKSPNALHDAKEVA